MPEQRGRVGLRLATDAGGVEAHALPGTGAGDARGEEHGRAEQTVEVEVERRVIVEVAFAIRRRLGPGEQRALLVVAVVPASEPARVPSLMNWVSSPSRIVILSRHGIIAFRIEFSYSKLSPESASSAVLGSLPSELRGIQKSRSAPWGVRTARKRTGPAGA